MSRAWQIICITHLLALGLAAGELTFKNVHVRTRTLADVERFHGYAAHQFELENLSDKERTVTIQLLRDNYRSWSNIADLRRTVTLGAKSRKRVTLYQPPLSINSFEPNARFTVDGETRILQDAFGAHVDSSNNLGYNEPVVLLAGRSWTGSTVTIPTGSSPASHSVHAAEARMPQWPRHWLAYSGFDGVLLRAKEWADAPAEVRQAILQYVRTGGRLFVDGSIPLPPDARMLNAHQLVSRGEAAQALKETVSNLEKSDHGYGQYNEREETPQENLTEEIPPIKYVVFTLGWGMIQLFEGAADDDELDWHLIKTLKAIHDENLVPMPALAPVMAGARSFHAHDHHYYGRESGSFDDFFPVVDDATVPVRLMIVILIAFVILAGPVNLILLHKFKRRTWFLWTLPAVSVLTSAVVFVTALLSEGFTPTVRRDVITILDQQTQQAATIGALGIYAPVAPGQLEFSAHTEVTPLLNLSGKDFGGERGVDWTKGQVFTGKWVASRVPAHFALRKSEPRKERLSVTWNNGSPTVVNSLGTVIHHLWLADARGNIFEASTHLNAGQRADLQRVAGKQTVIDYVNTDFLLSTNKETPEDNYPANLAPGTYIASLANSPFAKNPIGRGKEKTHALVYGVLTKTEAGP